jgi:hypothetical protein
MPSNDLLLLVFMTLAAMTLMTFWRKVLLLILAIAVAVFVYGLINLSELIDK